MDKYLTTEELEKLLPSEEEFVSDICTFGDTEHNSNSVRYGMNLMRSNCLRVLKGKVTKAMGRSEILNIFKAYNFRGETAKIIADTLLGSIPERKDTIAFIHAKDMDITKINNKIIEKALKDNYYSKED